MRKSVRKQTTAKHSINALGENLLSAKLTDSISLLLLSQINLLEWDKEKEEGRVL